MTKLAINDTTLTDIADAIREKKGTQDTYTPAQMATQIENMQLGRDWSKIGYSSEPDFIKDGFDYAKEIYDNWEQYAPGYKPNYSNDKSLVFFPKVDYIGALNFSDSNLIYFPDNITIGNTTYTSEIGFARSAIAYLGTLNIPYAVSLGSSFHNCQSLRNVHLIVSNRLTTMTQTFYQCKKLESVIIEGDTSRVTTCNGMFYECSSLKEFPEIDTSSVTNMGSCMSSCGKLETIPLLDLGQCENIYSMMGNMYALINIGGFKDLGKAYLTTRSANYTSYTLSGIGNKVTHDSLMNVINNLYDIATAGVQTQKLQLGSTNLAKLTAEEIAIATDKGWTVS